MERGGRLPADGKRDHCLVACREIACDKVQGAMQVIFGFL